MDKPIPRTPPTAHVHTDMDTADMDAVLAALADPTRRQLLERLSGHRAASASALARELPVSRQAVAKHLTVLQEAGLVTGRRAGREVVFEVEPAGLRTAASWMTAMAEAWDARLQRLKQIAEAEQGREAQDRPPRNPAAAG
ncbi:MAG TPA: metalloregulator ArsR/SmtB family transcription factor [Actinocrinis sp.]|jgi:DNA-binding transcriptional ArsR family regulator